MRLRSLLILWGCLGVVALVGAIACVYLFRPPVVTSADVRLRGALTEDQAWDALAGLLSRYLRVEKVKREPSDETWLICTDWTMRVQGRDLDGHKARALVFLERKARTVRIMTEAMRLDGETWKSTDDGTLLAFLQPRIKAAVGDIPVPT